MTWNSTAKQIDEPRASTTAVLALPPSLLDSQMHAAGLPSRLSAAVRRVGLRGDRARSALGNAPLSAPAQQEFRLSPCAPDLTLAPTLSLPRCSIACGLAAGVSHAALPSPCLPWRPHLDGCDGRKMRISMNIHTEKAQNRCMSGRLRTTPS